MVAHFHYVLSLGAVFGILCGITLWRPLILGTCLRRVGLRSVFGLMFLGVNLTFFPMHFLGLRGIPRRYRDYPDLFLSLNVVCGVGRVLRLRSMVLLLVVVADAIVSIQVVVFSLALSGSLEWGWGSPSSSHSTVQSVALVSLKVSHLLIIYKGKLGDERFEWYEDLQRWLGFCVDV